LFKFLFKFGLRFAFISSLFLSLGYTFLTSGFALVLFLSILFRTALEFGGFTLYFEDGGLFGTLAGGKTISGF
jgi:hypothetical protein